jgi:hypothetical protein
MRPKQKTSAAAWLWDIAGRAGEIPPENNAQHGRFDRDSHRLIRARHRHLHHDEADHGGGTFLHAEEITIDTLDTDDVRRSIPASAAAVARGSPAARLIPRPVTRGKSYSRWRKNF